MVMLLLLCVTVTVLPVSIAFYDELTVASAEPPGIGHLEDPELASDLTMARDFDLGISGPPLHIPMDFISSGLIELLAGLTACALLFAYAWWAPLVLGGAWLATHWLLRESGVWKDRQTDAVREAHPPRDKARPQENPFPTTDPPGRRTRAIRVPVSLAATQPSCGRPASIASAFISITQTSLSRRYRS